MQMHARMQMYANYWQLSNVDQSHKEDIQEKLKKMLSKLKITTIIVTHDSYEAFYLGSKCGIILNNQLKQYDDPYNVYIYPILLRLLIS